MITWLHAPGHAGSMTKDVIEFAFEDEPLIVDWSEMYWNVDDLVKHAAEGYRHFHGKAKRKDARGRVVNHDVVISTRIDVEVVHSEEFFVCAQVKDNLKYMPARYGKAQVLDYAGERILIVIWHPQPNPMRPLRIKRVLPMYRRSVRRVEAVQKRLEKKYKPDVVLNGGDLQVGPGLMRFYPNKIAKRNGMSYRRHKIDWQLWKGAKLLSFTKKNPSTQNRKMDHKWTLLRLR